MTSFMDGQKKDNTKRMKRRVVVLNDTEHKGGGFTTHAKNLLQGGSTGLIGESNRVKQILGLK